MRLLTRLFQRFLVFCLGVLSVWLIVFVVFDTADHRLPWVLAVCVTYGVAAYIILPNVVRLYLKVLHRGVIPRYTIAADGLAGDPVNVVLIGTLQQLCEAFATAGWSTADRLGTASSLRMIRAFLRGSAYPTAPFSTFYLFGRRQDIGFQEPIDDSPRKRRVRFGVIDVHVLSPGVIRDVPRGFAGRHASLMSRRVNSDDGIRPRRPPGAAGWSEKQPTKDTARR